MGQHKNALIRADERGWYETEKNVCAECVGSEFLQNVLRNAEHTQTCDYCGNLGAAPLDFLMEEFIMPAIRIDYRSADGAPQYLKEDGDLFATSEEMVESLFYSQPPHYKLIEDISESLTHDCWVGYDLYEPPPSERNIRRWKGFGAHVKHSSRYFFGEALLSGGGAGEEPSSIATFLTELRDIIHSEKLIDMFNAGTKIYRARIDKKQHTDPKELAAPPMENTKYSNRMTPAGIIMCYGTFDPETAMLEVGAVHNDHHLSLATFATTKDVLLIDFTNLPEAPDTFDLDQHDRRHICQFLYMFTEELNQPIKKDGREHIEYVPTQVFTEFLRNQFDVAGMVFPSSKKYDGNCVVLWGDGFVPDENKESPGLTMEDVQYFIAGYKAVPKES